MWKPLVLAGLLLGFNACAARQPGPDEDPSSARVASYRVVLVNNSGSQLKYSYSRYLSPEAQRQQMPLDPQRNMATTLSFGIAFEELEPGGNTFLDVIPGSGLTLVYLQNGQEQRFETPVKASLQYTVGPAGVQPGPLPSIMP